MCEKHICEKTMKLFKGKKLVSLAAALCVMVGSASAAVIDSAVYNTNTNTVTVKGNMQNVPTIKTSGNLLENSDCSSESLTWLKKEGGTVERVMEENGNYVVRSSGKTEEWHGIRQDIYSQLNKYGKGEYRVSGKIKADDLNVTVTNSDGEEVTATVTKANYYVYFRLKNHTKISFPIQNVGSEWVEFEKIVDVNSYGLESSGGDELDGFDSSRTELAVWATANAIPVDADGNKYTKIDDTRDFYVDDVKLEKIERPTIYKGEETVGIAVEDTAGDMVYFNDVQADAKGDYAISFQLPDGVSAEGLTAKVHGKNTDPYDSAQITSAAVEANIKTVYTGDKVKVSFDIFDFFDSSNYSDVTVIAASYTKPDNTMYDVNTKVVKIDLALSSTQSVEVAPPTGDCYVKLFLLNDLNQIVPLCTVHSADVTLNESTLYLIGDSICVEYTSANSEPQAGWGEYIETYLSDKLTVVNCAHGGFSTATYLNTSEYCGGYAGAHTWNSDTLVNSAGSAVSATAVLPMIKEGDYVIVSLGINDSSTNSEKNVGVDIDTYKSNLVQMAQDTKAKGATMIFVTPTVKGKAQSDGTYSNTMAERGTAMKEAAQTAGVVCVDLGAELAAIYTSEGEAKVSTYHLVNSVLTAPTEDGGFGLTDEQIAAHTNKSVASGGNDYTHLSHKGADLVAKTIARLIADSPSALSKYVLDNAN